MKLSDVQERTLRALRQTYAGPAFLSAMVWPGHDGLRKGAAPGTGLVRPMLAVLARLRKAGLVEWFSNRDEPVRWALTLKGMDQLYLGTDEKIRLLHRRSQ